MPDERQNEVDKIALDVANGKQDADCAKAMLHIKYCENCRKNIIENGEPLNR